VKAVVESCKPRTYLIGIRSIRRRPLFYIGAQGREEVNAATDCARIGRDVAVLFRKALFVDRQLSGCSGHRRRYGFKWQLEHPFISFEI
jgi:hypothetical protein